MKDEVPSNASSVKLEPETESANDKKGIADKELQRNERYVQRYVIAFFSVLFLLSVLIFAWIVKKELTVDSMISGNRITEREAAQMLHEVASGNDISMQRVKEFLEPSTTHNYPWLFPCYVISVTLLVISLFIVIYNLILVIKAEINRHSSQPLLFTGILNSSKMYFSILGTLILANLIVPFTFYYGITSVYYSSILSISDWTLDHKVVSSSTMWIYTKVLPGLFKAIGILFVKDLIVYLLNFNVHYKYYRLRIEQNEDKLKVARMMIDLTNSSYSENIDGITSKFIEVVGNDGVVTFSALQAVFSDEIAYKIANYCNVDNELAAEDIKKFFETTILENEHLKRSIEHNNATVGRFGVILTIIVVPLVLYQILEIILASNNPSSGGSGNNNGSGWPGLTQNTYLLGTMVFSTNYTFSDTLKGFVNSLVFVFFIRPFEMGDMIIVDGKLYKVHEISLLTTMLFNGQEFSTFINSELCKMMTRNLRLNGIWEVTYNLKFKIGDLRAQQRALVENVAAYISTKTSEFRKGVFISNINLNDDGKTDVSLTVKLNCNVASVEILLKRKTALFFKIQEILDKLPV